MWLNMDGFSIKSLLRNAMFPSTPDLRTLAHNFEEPPNLGESYASRLYGWFAPPETGNYQFYVCTCGLVTQQGSHKTQCFIARTKIRVVNPFLV